MAFDFESFSDEILHQQRNIFRPLAQRRQVHGDDVQPIVEILAERPLLHHLRQVGVGRGDDADVDLDGARVADALELALLQHAQQLHLQRHRHRPHLVEEQRAAVGLLEPALPHRHRAGERAADVAEQLGIEQRLGNRADVERDEPLAMPRAGLMDRARHHLLAGAGLARDQNRGGRRRHGFDQLKERAHRRALADHRAEAEPLVELLMQIRVLVLQPPLLERRTSARAAARRTETAWR